jgi:hypothetical protein
MDSVWHNICVLNQQLSQTFRELYHVLLHCFKYLNTNFIYSSGWALAFWTICHHSSLFPFTFILQSSSCTSSNHLSLGLSSFLVHSSEAHYLVSEQFNFNGVRLLAWRSNPNLEDQVVPLRLACGNCPHSSRRFSDNSSIIAWMWAAPTSQTSNGTWVVTVTFAWMWAVPTGSYPLTSPAWVTLPVATLPPA